MESNEQNKLASKTKAEPDRSQSRGVGGLEDTSQRTYIHIGIAHGHKQKCDEGRGEGHELDGMG